MDKTTKENEELIKLIKEKKNKSIVMKGNEKVIQTTNPINNTTNTSNEYMSKLKNIPIKLRNKPEPLTNIVLDNKLEIELLNIIDDIQRIHGIKANAHFLKPFELYNHELILEKLLDDKNIQRIIDRLGLFNNQNIVDYITNYIKKNSKKLVDAYIRSFNIIKLRRLTSTLPKNSLGNVLNTFIKYLDYSLLDRYNESLYVHENRYNK
ncbi:MAG: hypothetical protein KatS3mg035_0047 [Bacteroidia bacterium]|nr:MAG: hypothetical protein KatS3mg035_0047 [Bacteroidia bacterium]